MPVVTPRLIKACDRFGRVANIIDALPGSHRPADDAPLINSMPGIWPTVGDIRELRDALKACGWKPNP